MKNTAKNEVQALDTQATYQMDGRTFIVESVFQEDSKNSIATLLLSLMRTDAKFQ